ncbi:MAG: ribose transport system substrate-binding protein [Halanaerobiales bacterium]|nr:ribose transport system substrate-binding protein [Halanaerobiales bacterium]
MKRRGYLLILAVVLLSVFVGQLALAAVKLPEITHEMLTVAPDQPVGEKGVFADDKLVIGFSQRRLAGSEWYENLINVAKKEAEHLGVELIVFDAQGDIAKQISDIETLIAKQVDALIVNPQDSEGVLPAIKKVHETNIPLVVVNSALSPEGAPFTFVSTDAFGTGFKSGQELAKAVVEKWGNKKEVKAAIISGYPKELESDRRRWGQIAGYTDYMLEKYGRNNLNIVSLKFGHWLPDVTMPIVQDIVMRNPDLDIIFAACDGTTQGVVSGLQSTGKLGDILIGSIDGRKSVIKWMMEDDKGIAVSVMNDPRLMGKWAVFFAAYKAMGAVTPSQFFVPNPAITPENAAEYYNPDSSY